MQSANAVLEIFELNNLNLAYNYILRNYKNELLLILQAYNKTLQLTVK
jgi:hypothetical protein